MQKNNNIHCDCFRFFFKKNLKIYFGLKKLLFCQRKNEFYSKH